MREIPSLKLILESLALSFAAACLMSFMPFSPFITLFAGGIGSYWLQKRHFKLYGYASLLSRSKNIYSIGASFLNASLTAYIFVLHFTFSLGKPAEDSWFIFAPLDHLFRNSFTFKWSLFAFAFLLSFLSNFLGAFIVFKLKIFGLKADDEILLSSLKDHELNEYCEEGNH